MDVLWKFFSILCHQCTGTWKLVLFCCCQLGWQSGFYFDSPLFFFLNALLVDSCQLVWITIIQVRAQTCLLSGLRGAVAFNLAARDTSTEVRRTILTTTLLLVSFTIWVLGTAADPVLRCLDIRSVLTLRRVTISVWWKSHHWPAAPGVCDFPPALTLKHGLNRHLH